MGRACRDKESMRQHNQRYMAQISIRSNNSPIPPLPKSFQWEEYRAKDVDS